MTALAWTPELQLDHPQMDHTHEEFVALLAEADAALAAEPAQLLARWQALCSHTVEHFAQEDRWMAATGFAPENCHAFQHQAVLQVMQECERRAREQDDFEPLRVAVAELAVWFPQHAQMMDAALVHHMAQVGYDPVSGRCARPLGGDGEPAPAISGCGGSSCS
ncbi:MAG: hemerythrin domain-containing protein [Burkholderiaceae bacterium]|nr:hemerythrin domain-containing protein [Burkholderiaceae bacterium]